MAEKRVEHGIHGKGVVKGERYQGNELFVEFQDGVGRWIPAREIRIPELEIVKNAILLLQKNKMHHPAKIPGSVLYKDQPKTSEIPDNPLVLQSSPVESGTIRLPSQITANAKSKIRITEEPLLSAVTANITGQSPVEPVSQEFQITKSHTLSEKKSSHAVQSAAGTSVAPSAMAGKQFTGAFPDITANTGVKTILAPSPGIPIKDNETVFPETTPVKTVRSGRQIRPCSPERFEARRIIEALRVGVVPHNHVQEFSCGRENESEVVKTWLANKKQSCIFFSGEYGEGKSHMLEITAAHALQNNWAVAIIEINPDESPFNQPKKIYREIAKSLMYQEGENLAGFRNFILKILNSDNEKKIEILREHLFLGSLLTAWHEMSDDSTYLISYNKTDLLLWIEGEEIQLPALPVLKSQQTAANVYCNILSGLGWAARNILGLKGILILVDEGEGIDKGWYNQAQFEKASTFIRGLVLMASSASELLTEHKEMEERFWNNRKGSDTGLYYGGTKAITVPFLWKDESSVKMVFSFTPNIIPFVRSSIIGDKISQDIPYIELEDLEREDLERLYDKIHTIYNTAYEFSSKNSIFPILPKEKIRLFVKGAVEALDVMRYNPESYREELGIEETP